MVMGASIGDFAGIPTMSAKRSTTDDPTNFSAFKIIEKNMHKIM
jgi:hypothetical protein